MARHLPVLFISVLAFASCAKTYKSPVIDPPDRTFDGIASQLIAADSVRVLFVHGMCTHCEEDWIDRGWDPVIREALRAEFQTQKRSLVKADQDFQVIDRTYTVKGDKVLSAAFVLWSPATTPLKRDALGYDRRKKDGGDFPLKRARINGAVKDGLINDCFADAVIYSGARGPDLMKKMKDAICTALGECQPDTPVVVVTESLGSKIVFDAILGMLDQTSDRVLARTSQIFMLANQLPLLGLTVKNDSEGAAAPPQPLALFSEKWRKAQHSDTADLSVVAFTDPNDLLSYRLRASDFPGIDTINVMASNAATYAGLVENPGAAHNGYEHNERVMKMILCGHGRTHCEQLKGR